MARRASGADGADTAARALVHGSVPPRPRAAVLFLHGGRADGLGPPGALNLPGARMRPFAARIAREARPDGVLVGHVRYRHRGWNGPREDAVRDGRRALRELRDLTAGVPVVLVGHSMGGRAALRMAGDSGVEGVVALAPWCPPGEPVAHLADARVVALHDQADRVTDADGTWSHLARAQHEGARTLGIRMPEGGHAMLRGARDWHRLATTLTLGLLGLAPLPAALTGPDGAATTPQPAGLFLTPG
ncbi:alpha/beta hydrolase [Streptomyces sp. NPDC101733]|uniref:alpha/beta hydrolase n=1 Tax=unclassified Streptomyces TaxID=2593676 RepID=UPI003813C853